MNANKTNEQLVIENEILNERLRQLKKGLANSSSGFAEITLFDVFAYARKEGIDL